MSQAPQLAQTVQQTPWFERAISAVAPGYGLRRLEARVQRRLFEYQAAQADRLYSPKTWSEPAESSGTARDRLRMMWEALDLVENFPPAKAVISRFGTFLTPTEYAPATGDRDYDAVVAEYFHGWCKRCDVTGRHSFRKLIQIAVEMRPAYGDCGIALRRTDAGLKLQLVSGDRIGNPNEMQQAELGDGRFYFSGVITDKFGAPTHYRVFRVDSAGMYRDPEDIPASQFFHYFDPFRADQYRGVTDFHAVARTARMLKEILDAEQVGVRFASQQAALVFTERGQAPTRNLFTPQNAATMANGEQPKHEQTDIGTIRYLYQGDRVETMPSRPGTAFGGFVQTLMHEIALGLGGYPAGVLWGTQDFKGPSVRAEFAQADRVNARHQGILDDKILCPTKDAVILDAIARSDIPPPPRKAGESFEDSVIRATRGSFRFPPRLTIDVGRESQARIGELLNGAGSLQEIAAEDGKDAFTRLEEKAQAAAWISELAEKYEVPETAIILPGGQIPATPAGAAAVGERAGEGAAAAQAGATPKNDTKPSDDAPESDEPAVREAMARLVAPAHTFSNDRAQRFDFSGELMQLGALMRAGEFYETGNSETEQISEQLAALTAATEKK
jgi:capsid protein